MADDAPEAAPEDAGAAGEAPTYRRPATAPKIKRMMQVRPPRTRMPCARR